MSAPAGWYPDANGNPRWWDGYRWVDAAPVATAATVGVPPRVAPGTSANTVWIWLIAVLPIVGMAVGVFFFSQMIPRMMEMTSTLDPSAGPQALLVQEQQLIFSPAYAATVLVSFVSYGAYVLFAFFDFRALRNRGFVNPFHWAWMFLSVWVYVIGRTVIVSRRGARGAAPLVVFILVVVLGALSFFAWLFSFMMQLIPGHLSAT